MAESVIRARLQTKGFEEGTAAVNRFSRAQQNVGKASAASGRQFSAQASGLGGFVAAYAGAAANIFAVQQAFSALSRAAQVETTIRGTRTLASEIGQSGDAIIAKLQEVTQSQLTAAEAAQNANIALSAGFDIQQIEQLTEVATKASKALGRNLTESIQRVYRGAIKLEPELLDEIGIFTRIEPAVEAYAASLNRSVSSLTNFERRQAFATAVIEEGQKKFNEIDITSASAQKSLEQLSTSFIDLATKVGGVLARALVPLADFLSGDLGNTLLVLGGIFTLVFSNAAGQVAQFTETMVSQLTRGLGKLEEFGRKAQGTGEAFKGALATAQEADYSGAGAFRGDRGTAAAATKAKQQIAAGEIRTQAQAAAARKALEAQIKAERDYIRAVEDGTKKVKDRAAAVSRSNIAITAATVQVNALASAERAAGAASTVLAGTTRLLTTAVQGLGMAVSFVLSKLNIFLFVLTSIQTVGQLFGVDIIGSIVGWFKKLGEESRKTTQGIQSFAAALTSVSKTELKLAGFEDQEEFLDQVSDKLKDLRTEYRRAGEAGTEWGGGLQEVTLSIAESTEKAQTRVEEITKRLENLEKRGRSNTRQYAKLNRELLVLKSVIETLPMRDFALINAELADATGRNGKEVANSLKSLLDFGTIINKNNKTLEVGGTVLATYVNGQFKLNEAGKAIAPTLIQADRLFKNFVEKFEAGSLDVEKASRALVGLRAQLKANEKAFKDGKVSAEQFEAANAAIQSMINKVLPDFTRLQVATKELEQFRKAFSSEIKRVDEAYSKGLIGLDGTIAKDSTEAFRNRLNLIKAAKLEEEKLAEAGMTVKQALESQDSAVREIAKRIQASRKAEVGLVIQLKAEMEKMVVEEGRLLLKVKGQSKELALQANILREQVRLNQIKNKSLALDVLQAETNVLKQQVALEKIRFENIMKSSKAERDLLAARQEGAGMQRDIDTTNFMIGIDAMALRDQERLIRAQKKVFDSRNLTERDILVAQRELLAIEYRNKRNELDRRRAIAEFEYKNAMAEITEKLKILEFERTDLVKRIAFEKDQQQKAFELLKTEQKIANDRLQIKIDELRGQKDFINAQRELEILKVRNQEAAFLNGLREIQERYRLLDEQKRVLREELKARQEILNLTIPGGNIEVDTSFLDSDTSAITELNKRINLTTANYADKISMIGTKYDDQINTIEQQISNQERLLEIQKEAQRIAREIQIEQDAGRITELEGQKKLLDQKIINTNQEFTKLEAEHIRKLAQLDAEGQKEYLNHLAKIYQLEEEANKLTQFQERLNSAFSGTLNQSIDDFFAALENGTLTVSNFKDGVGDMFLSLLKDVRQSFVDEFIKDPLTDLIKKFVNGIVEAFKEGMDSGGGSGGLIGQIGGFIGSFLVPNSPTATPGASVAAIGGPVQKMAAGGNVTSGRSVSLRDRVPTLLEPGEFVIRKPAAKAIGGSALRELNATGKVNQNPNISVNVSNQGTPQEVVKTEARPDMGQLVIDLVVKDIENNGRTRKALRGA